MNLEILGFLQVSLSICGSFMSIEVKRDLIPLLTQMLTSKQSLNPAEATKPAYLFSTAYRIQKAILEVLRACACSQAVSGDGIDDVLTALMPYMPPRSFQPQPLQHLARSIVQDFIPTQGDVVVAHLMEAGIVDESEIPAMLATSEATEVVCR
jgi:hypothetical protein